jgi:hypothetical protein
MKEQKISKWDNLQIGHIPNEVDQISRMKNILIVSYISGNGVEESNIINKNLYNRWHK